MARVDTPVIQNIKTLDHWLACGGHQESYINATTGMHTTVNDDTVPRPRPEYPLWEHPTSLGPNYTKERTYAVVKTADPWYTKKCNDGKTYPGWKMERLVDVLDGYPVTKMPSWEYQLRNRIADVRVNLSSDIAEVKSTASMVADLAKTVRDTIREIARPGIKKIRRQRLTPKQRARRINDLIRDICGKHLAISFGWVPTISTICDVVEKQQSDLKVPRIRRVTLKDARRGSFSEVITTTSGRTYKWTGTYRNSVRPTAYVAYTFSDETNGLTAGNILEAGWELVTFSFVIDWIIPIGDWLSSLTALSGVEVRALTLGYERYIEGDCVYTGNQSSWVAESDGRIEQVTRGRSLETFHVIPPLPDLAEEMGTRRALNAISLLGVLVGKEISTRL